MKKILLICFVVFLGSYSGRTQNISTIAGDGCLGPDSGDGIPATSACIGYPAVGCFDGIGNYYFAEDFGSSRIEKISSAGIITTVAGNGASGYSGDGGPATNASLVWPYAIADLAGNIYIPDRDNHRLRKVDVTTGIITTIAGNGHGGHSGDGGPATAASLWPTSVCLDAHGNIFVTDSTTWIREISVTGIIATIAGNGYQGFSGDDIASTASGLFNTVGLCTDNHGNLLIGSGEGRIRKLNISTGIITTIAGNGTTTPYLGDGMPATDAQFYPYTIAVDFLGVSTPKNRTV